MNPRNPQNDNLDKEEALYKRFLNDLTEITVCIYCEEPCNDGNTCCGEHHKETVYDDGKHTFRATSLVDAFKEWCAERDDRGPL